MTLTRWVLFRVALLFAVVRTAALEAQSSGNVAGWNDARTRALVEMATRRRAEQLADTGLVDYRARARGYVTFLAQMGDGFLETPRLVKTDQLALEVYWRAPNLSKQRIIGRRDTTLFPTDIQYHRDHLGIVQNNFPESIRIGEGDEVRDVPHPLSAAGLRLYDFAIGDSIRIRAGSEAINLIEVKVRPKEDRDPRVIGALYLEPEGAQVVRMAFNFTRAAFLDDHLEDLAVMLENRLVGGKYWLPSRQQIEIRRTGTYMEFPVRGIIRGWWEVDEYQFNVALPAQMFAGSEIVFAPPAEVRAYPWTAPIMDSLPPDVRGTIDPDIQRIQEEARVLVRARALERVQPLRVSARRASDFVRANRVEGLSFGVGFTARIAPRVFLNGRARMGMDDHHQVRPSASLRWEQPSGTRFEVFTGLDLRDIGDQPERSTLINSIASNEFASDLTDPFSFEQRGARFVKRFGSVDWSIAGAREQHKAVSVHSRPATGQFLLTPQVDGLRAIRGTVGLDRSLTTWAGPGRLSLTGRASILRTIEPPALSGFMPEGSTSYRASVGLEHRSEKGPVTVMLRENAAFVAGAGFPLQEAVYFGGPVSLPGYGLHEVAGQYGSTTRLEVQVPVPFIGIPLGRFGRIPPQARLAPYMTGAVVGGSLSCTPTYGRCPRLTEGFYPSVGVGLLTIYDLLRFDVARGLRDGRWMFTFDVHRDFWSIL
jgi:hypothetical protein